MRKKVIVLIASVAMVVTMIPTAAFAAEETKGVPCDGGPYCTHEAEAQKINRNPSPSGVVVETVHFDKFEDVFEEIELDAYAYSRVKLLRDVELDSTLKLDKAYMSIDLSGNDISKSTSFNSEEPLISINKPYGYMMLSNGNVNGEILCNEFRDIDVELTNVNIYNRGKTALSIVDQHVLLQGKCNIDGDISISKKSEYFGMGKGISTESHSDVVAVNGKIILNEGCQVSNRGTLNADIEVRGESNLDFVNVSNSGVINGDISGGVVRNTGKINHTHSYNDWITMITPTDTMIGLHYHECSVCGEKEYAFMPATGSATMPGGNTGGSSGNSSGSGTGGGSGSASENGSTGKLEAVPGTDNAVRVSGDTRFETATNVADQLKEIYGVEKFDNIVITYSDIFADAMSATALAADKEAPILVVNENNEGYVKKYVSENLTKNGNVYIIGGTGVVSERFENSLENYKVKRISGKDRYETNLEVLKELNLSGTEEIMIASGSGFADALSASATGNAIMLVGDKLTVEQEAFIKSLNAKNEYFVVGGTGAVNNAVYNQVKTAGSGDVTRISGSTRYDTSAAIAEEFFGKAKSVFVASGDDFPDGLTGGVLANATGAPLLLANENNTSQAENFVVGNKARMVTAIGGTKALSDKAIGKIA